MQRLAIASAHIVSAQEWKEREAVAFGAKTTDFYRVGEDHGIGDMLRLLVSAEPCGDVLSSGIAAAADDLMAFTDWIAQGGGAECDDTVIQRVGDGIQNRLRVLAEMARRMRDAVNVDAAVAS